MTEPFQKKQGLGRIRSATCYSWNGLKRAITSETAFRQELLVVTCLMVTLFFLPLSLIWKCVLIFPTLSVLVVELLNSAIESVVGLSRLPHSCQICERFWECGRDVEPPDRCFSLVSCDFDPLGLSRCRYPGMGMLAGMGSTIYGKGHGGRRTTSLGWHIMIGSVRNSAQSTFRE